ncbi:hypothetical protein ACF0H5_013931 [Mactra antiquata]
MPMEKLVGIDYNRSFSCPLSVECSLSDSSLTNGIETDMVDDETDVGSIAHFDDKMRQSRSRSNGRTRQRRSVSIDNEGINDRLYKAMVQGVQKRVLQGLLMGGKLHHDFDTEAVDESRGNIVCIRLNNLLKDA